MIVLEELGLPYCTKSVESAEMKMEPYLSINPNGRSVAGVEGCHPILTMPIID